MRTKLLISAAAALLLASCAQHPPRAQVVPQPPKTPSLGPKIDEAGKNVDAAKKTSTELAKGLDKATAELDRLVKQKQANEAELKNLWSILTQEKQRTRDLWDQLEASGEVINQLRAASAAKDLEVTTVRQSLDTANQELAAARKWQDMAAPKVAIYDKVDGFLTKMKWVIIIVLVLAGVWAFLVYALPPLLKVLKPL